MGFGEDFGFYFEENRNHWEKTGSRKWEEPRGYKVLYRCAHQA